MKQVAILLFMLFVFSSLALGKSKKQSKQDKKIKAIDNKVRKLQAIINQQQEALEDMYADLEGVREEGDISRDDQTGTKDEVEGMIEAFSKSLRFNGFAAFEYFNRAAEKSTLSDLTPFQKKNAFFRFREINLIATVAPVKSFRLFASLRFARDSSSQFMDNRNIEEVIEINGAYVEYKPLSNLKIRVGRFFTNFGIWGPMQRKNLILTFDSRAIGFLKEQIFPKYTTGLEAAFNFELPKGGGEVSFWIGNGKRRRDLDPAAVPATLNGLDMKDLDDPAIGGKIGIELENINITEKISIQQILVGFSGYFGKVPQNTTDPTDEFQAKISKIYAIEGGPYTPYVSLNPHYLFNGEPVEGYTDRALNFHFKITMMNISLQTECTLNWVKPQRTVVKSFFQYGYYVMLSYNFNPVKWFGKTKITSSIGRFTPFFLFDYYEANDEIKAELNSRKRFVFGLNWRVSEYLTWKFEYQSFDFLQRANLRNYDMFVTQLVFSF